MIRAPWFIAFALLLLVVTALPAKAASRFCPFGTCTILDPVYVNVYWDTSEQQWNKDIAVNDPLATVNRIDSLTAAICHSNYFNGLYQYDVHSCSMQPSIIESGCGPLLPDLDQVHSKLGDFATCVMSTHPSLDPSRTVLNVFIPPQVYPSWCNPNQVAEHGSYGSPVQLTFIPTNSSCGKLIAGISGNLTHEMVEVATDPIHPWGWYPEIGDQCETFNPRYDTFLIGQVSSYFSNTFNSCTNSEVNSSQPLQSANVNVCGSGKNARITISGSFDTSPWDLVNGANGARTLFLTGAVSGSHNFKFGDVGGFWNSPADMVGFGPISWTSNQAGGPSCAGMCGISDQACISQAAGSSKQMCTKTQKQCLASCKPPTPVTNQIVINGFDGAYGAGLLGQKDAVAAVAPGDTVSITLWSWMSGQQTIGSGTVPGPTNINNFMVKPSSGPPMPIFIGDAETISGQIVDPSGCPIGGVDVQLSASDTDPSAISPATNAIPPATTATYDDGTFFADYKPSSPAGVHKIAVVKPITGSIPVPVRPNAWSLDKSRGPVAGDKLVTLTGSGFDATPGATEIEFDGNLATVVTITADGQTAQFYPPPSKKGPGMVQVVASVNSQNSLPLPFQYYVPNQPIFSFAVDCVTPQISNKGIRVDAYDADGNPASEQITLTAAYPAFYSGIGMGPGNPAVATFTLSPGGGVAVTGNGPFTATPSADPTLAVTEKFDPDAPVSGCSDPVAKYILAAVSYIPGPGPVETTAAQPMVDRGGFLIWSNTPTPEQATAYILITGATRATGSSPKDVQVRTLGSHDLMSMALGRPFGFARDRKEATRLRLLGPNLSVAPSRSAPSKAWLGSASIAFLLPAGSNPSEYAILRGGPQSQSWIEVASLATTTNGRTLLRANIGDSGTFVLTRVDPPRR